MADFTIIKNEGYQPFNRYIDIGGLRIFGLDEVSDNFLNKVASTYEAMLASNNLINLEMRSAFIDTLKENYIFQRVGFDSPEYYGGGDKLPQHPINGNYKDNQTDYIWEGLSRSEASQISTVIEHLLHTITGVGFAIQFSEWDPQNPSSKINLAMEQAIEGGYYDVSSYESIKLRGDDAGYAKAIVIEFSYWLILAEWEYFEITDKANNNIEFTLRTASDIASKLPLAHELYLDTAAKILSRPDETIIQSLFSKESEHNDSVTSDESSASELKQQTYQEAGQSIEIIENSGTSYIDSLLNTQFGNPIKWVSDSFLNAEYSVNNSTVISYSFPGLLGTTALFNYTDDVGEIVAVPFSAQQAADTRLALAKISEYINVTFVEIEEVGDAVGTIRFGINTITDEEGNYREGIAATADPPSEEPRGGDVWFNKWFTNVADFSTGLVPYGKGDNIGSQTGVGDGAILIHEILHALGIEHPGDHPTILFPEDKNSREYTVMAGEFNNHPSVYIDGVDYIVSSTPMVYDIAAIQYLYGANMNHNRGDTTYSFDPDTPFIEAIWDAGGNDTLDFSNFSKTNTISLMDGEHSTIGFDVNWTMPEHLSIAFNAIIENVIGGSGDDTIKGNTSDNNIDGGFGIDTVIYNDEYSNYSITKNSAGFIIVKHSDTGSITNEGEDTLSNIEKIQFTDQTIETSSINNIDDSIYSREGTFLGNNYTIKMLGDNEEEIYAKGTGNAFVVGRDVFSEEQVKGILDNYEYVIKSISKTLSWKGTLDFVVVVQGDTGHPTGLLPSMAFQHGEDLTGEAGVLLGTNEERVHVATYEQLTGIDLNGDEPDLGFYINVTENNEFKNFDSYVWIDPAPNLTSYSNLPEGQHDLISIITHEITHAMGLAGTLDPYWSVNHYSKSLTEKDGQYYYSSERITNLLGKDLYTEYEAGRSDDDSLDHHVLDPEGGISGIASLMSGEMYSQRWSEPGPIEYAILYDSGWTERTTGKLSETINPNQNILRSFNENSLSGTLNFSSGNNIIIADGQAKTLRGLDGDDTYFISNLLPKDSSIEIIDTSGINTIQIAANTKVIKTLWTKDAARLTFEDDRVITINGADKFTFNLGGNITNGEEGLDVTFSEFAFYFGINDINSISGSETGEVTDLYII